jgi:hypothetical protein
MRSRIVSRLVLVVLALPACGGALISSSRIEQCYDDGGPLDCDRRLTVALAIASGQRGTEEVQTVSEEEESELTLERPLRVSLYKTDAVVRYPVHYLQSFNAQPFEVVTHHGLGGCNDGDMANSPSCGWVLSSDGARILNSQGFCCSCGFDQILGTSSTTPRSETLQCDLFGDAQSAHCLRMDDLWYAAYELGAPQLHFVVSAEVSQDNGTVADYTLELGPHAPGAASEDGRLTARLLGDLAGTRA